MLITTEDSQPAAAAAAAHRLSAEYSRLQSRADDVTTPVEVT